jgi:hypothetical protein
MSDPIIESVIEKLRSRSVRGLDKYGVGLDREDLSVVEWLTHLQEELLDAAGYVEKLIQVMGGRKKKEEVYGPPPPTLKNSWDELEKMLKESAEKWRETNQPPPIVYGPPPATIPKTAFDPNTVICREEKP